MKRKLLRENEALPLVLPTLIFMALFTVVPLIDASLINHGQRYVGPVKS